VVTAIGGFDPQYGKRTRDWLEQRYESCAAIGHEPITDRPWLRIYRRTRPASVEMAQAAATKD
jgi:hypothetical protein